LVSFKEFNFLVAWLKVVIYQMKLAINSSPDALQGLALPSPKEASKMMTHVLKSRTAILGGKSGQRTGD
jgi:hypothetical protein